MKLRISILRLCAFVGIVVRRRSASIRLFRSVSFE